MGDGGDGGERFLVEGEPLANRLDGEVLDLYVIAHGLRVVVKPRHLHSRRTLVHRALERRPRASQPRLESFKARPLDRFLVPDPAKLDLKQFLAGFPMIQQRLQFESEFLH